MSVPGNSESVEADAATEAALGRAAEAIWVAAQKASWSSLVLVPAEPSLSTAALAAAVAAVGSVQRGEPVERLDLEGLPLARSRSVAETDRKSVV